MIERLKLKYTLKDNSLSNVKAEENTVKNITEFKDYYLLNEGIDNKSIVIEVDDTEYGFQISELDYYHLISKSILIESLFIKKIHDYTDNDFHIYKITHTVHISVSGKEEL